MRIMGKMLGLAKEAGVKGGLIRKIMHGGLIRKIKRIDFESEEFTRTMLKNQLLSLWALPPSRTQHSSAPSGSLQYRMR